MVKSMQRTDLGDKRFTELQEEVREASETALQEFHDANSGSSDHAFR